MESSHQRKLSRPWWLCKELRHIQWATGPVLVWGGFAWYRDAPTAPCPWLWQPFKSRCWGWRCPSSLQTRIRDMRIKSCYIGPNHHPFPWSFCWPWPVSRQFPAPNEPGTPYDKNHLWEITNPWSTTQIAGASASKTHLTSLVGISNPECLFQIDGPSWNEKIRKRFRVAGFALFSPEEQNQESKKQLIKFQEMDHGTMKVQWSLFRTQHDTVDGRNHAIPGMYKTMYIPGINNQPQLVSRVSVTNSPAIYSMTQFCRVPLPK